MKRFFASLIALVLFYFSALSFGSTQGYIVAWGYNQYNQCDITSSDSNFVSIAAGSEHSFALRGNGSVVLWGWNLYGQCPDITQNYHFAVISAGGLISAGIDSNGTILTAGEYGETNVPDSNFHYVAIASGNQHSLAVVSDGSAVAWGYNGNHQCDIPEPNSGFVDVAAGYIHSLGLKTDGSIVAWGDNSAGQCNVPSPNKDFIAIAAGGLHSLGLKANGSIVAWGDNSDHQCRVPSPNTNFVALAGGYAHSLGLKADGTIKTWGWNDYGQRDVCAPNTRYFAVSGGFGHSLALQSECNFPSRPTGVSASDGLYPDHIRVTWKHVSKAAKYEVWRSHYNIPSYAAKVGDFNSPYNDYDIPSDAKVYYWVRAVNSCGESFFSLSNSGFTSLNPDSNDILIKKCTVTADTRDNNDSISISGLMNADFNDVNLADEVNLPDTIEVNISSDDLNIPCVQTFSVDGNTFKKGRFYCSKTIGLLKTSLAIDTKTAKFSFTARKIDLTGLTCPFTVKITAGNFAVTTDVNETIVNGINRPIPISLLMGLKNSLRVDKFNIHSSDSNTGWLSAKGGFSIQNVDTNMADSNFAVTLGSQTFSIPSNSFKKDKNGYTCSNLKLSDGSIASVNFNFKTCTFRLSIKKANIDSVAGPAEFSIDFADFNETADIILP